MTTTQPAKPADPVSDKPFVLGIEAATPSGGVALASVDSGLLAHVWRANTMPIATYLLPDIDRMLRECGAQRGQLGAIAVSHGPGAFTGLRLGLALAKTLAHGLGARLYTYSTLAMLARRALVDAPGPGVAEGGAICALLDARRGELYSGVYAAGGSAVLRPDAVEPLAALLDDLERAPWPVITFSGSGARLHAAALTARLGARARFTPAPWDVPAADMLALAGAADLLAQRPGVEPLAAEPAYLRVSDAERRHPILATGAAG